MRLRILLIDDDEKLGREIVAQLGTRHDVRTDADVDEFKPDLILLDYRLKEGDGVRWLGSYRQQGYRTPVIVISGYPDPRMAIDFMKLSVAGFLEKPFLMTELEEAIAKALNLAPLGFRLDRDQRCVRENGNRFDLTPTEFKILEVLVGNAGKAVDRQTLIQKAMQRGGQPQCP
ncbi:MAG TPA: response regulator [Bdellovibrionales bacterium]|nr:response regulator [Bdellovibrionales bacterium]